MVEEATEATKHGGGGDRGDEKIAEKVKLDNGNKEVISLDNFEWERKKVVKPSVYKPRPSGSDKREGHSVGDYAYGSCQVCNGSLAEKSCNKRISWHVESEDLWRLRSVTEVGFNDGTSYPLCNTGTRSSTTSEGSDESTDVSKSDSGKRVDEECSDQSRPSMEEEAFQSRCKERDSINKVYRDEEALRGQINVSELMGGEPNMLSVMNVEGLEKVGGKGSVDLKEINDDSGNVCDGSIQKDSLGELGLGCGHMSMIGP
ncbi:hypothetical protein V6N11_065576 [Hibiscus sabdariffa]|uniref:Uncharacterized protein n=1 Tax=Hibiscus sabdariffa TaxID=183260 RepID=A0ABR2PHV8_9ROSI